MSTTTLLQSLTSLGPSSGAAHEGVQLQNVRSPYQYTNLVYSEPQIRLLTLHPAPVKTATIECSLDSATLPSSNGSFEALSYVWGDQSTTCQVLVDGRYLRVTANLDSALRHLRYDARPRTLWVDAICINQVNMGEKNHQVRQMRSIFSSASRVLIWLGESDRDIDAALRYLQGPRRTRQEEIEAAFQALGAPDPGEMPTEVDEPVEGLRKLYTKPWWKRMWVVQELVAATVDPLVMCGDKCVDWTPVCEKIGRMAMESLLDQRSEIMANPLSAVFLYFAGPGSRNYTGQATLERLLRGTQSHEATDQRDHVYALLGLVSGDNTGLFPVDYTEPVRVAYQHAMVHMFSSRQDLNLLAHASGDHAVNIPSWCIDFSSQNWEIDASKSGLIIGDPDPLQGASKGRGFDQISHSPQTGTITLRGIRVGVIHSTVESTTTHMRRIAPVHRTVSQEDIDSAPVRDLTSLLGDTFVFHIHACIALEHRYGLDEAARMVAAGVIWKVAAGGNKFNSLLRQRPQPYLGGDGFGCLERIAQRVNPARANLLHTWSQQLPEEPAGFPQVAREALERIAYRNGNNSCYFTTDTCYIGLAYHPVREGDILCILFGCKYAVVLRLQDGGYYKFVALSYTNGIMEGELLRDSNSVQTEEFILM